MGKSPPQVFSAHTAPLRQQDGLISSRQFHRIVDNQIIIFKHSEALLGRAQDAHGFFFASVPRNGDGFQSLSGLAHRQK